MAVSRALGSRCLRENGRLISDRYFLKAISWARKYGLRILLDFHGLPGMSDRWPTASRRWRRRP
jgi:aryl-phospho-beta-D-glucosidase BglC (GH1 family)